MNYKLSIVVPFYNDAKYIERCSRSLFEQSYSDIEFVFVNDCSTDDSQYVLENVIRNYPAIKHRVKLHINETNKGGGRSRMIGIDMSSGEYVMCCDADDWIEKETCEQMLKIGIDNNADIIQCGMCIDRGVTREIELFPYTCESKETLKDMYLLNGIYSSLCNKMVRKELYVKHQIMPLPDVFMWDDFSVSFQLRFHSQKTVVVNKPFYHYMINVGESVGNFTEDKVQQQIRVAKFFEDFISSLNKSGEFENAINYVKFMSKLGYFTNEKIRNLDKWKKIYPESNDHVMQYKRIPLSRRIVFKLGLGLFPLLASRIYTQAVKIAR